MNEVVALACKDLRLLFRDRVGFFFAFGFPLVYCVFFGAVFSGAGGGGGTHTIAIAVVDEDRTEESGDFVATLAATPEFEVIRLDREEASARVRRGKLVAYVAIPPGFGERRDGMFRGDPPRIEVGIDPSRKAEAGMLQGLLMKCAFQRMQDMFTKPDVMSERIQGWLGDIRASDDVDPVSRGALEFFLPALDNFVRQMPIGESGGGAGAESDEGAAGSGWQPVVIEKADVLRERTGFGPSNSYAISFPLGIVWGLLGCSASFGISLVTERTHGTLVRLRMAPIQRWQILAGKAGACFATTVVMMTVLLFLGAIFFGIRAGSVPLLALAVVCSSLAFVGIMMFLSVLGKTEQAAGGIGWAVLLVMAMIGGGMIPQIFMPAWMKTISHASPVKWAILSMEGAIWRGFSPYEMILPCGILLGVGVVSFGIGVCAFRWTE